jgi:alkylation response protein AidB-like acyl-CoA dehydrogenase
MSFALTPNQERMRMEARAFAYEKVRPAVAEREWLPDPRERIDWSLIEEASARGWRTLGVPAEYGGPDEIDVLTFCVLLEELAAGDMGFAVNIDQTFKVSRIIARMADENQQAWFWPKFIANPRFVLAICSTEPAHGSDWVIPDPDFRYDTMAVRDGDDWLITGEKRYISNGADAGLYVVFANTNTDTPATQGTSAFLIPAESPGLEVTWIWEKISQRGINNATIRFSKVRVPDTHRLGGVNMGLVDSKEVLKESVIEAGATTLGSGRAAYEAAHAYAQERIQGGKPIIEHSNVAIQLASMATRLEAARSLIWQAARTLDADEKNYDPALGSMAKVFAAETAFEVAREACEIHGGAAVMIGESIVEKTLRDTLSFLHSDGTQQAHLLRVGQLLAERESVAPGVVERAVMPQEEVPNIQKSHSNASAEGNQ